MSESRALGPSTADREAFDRAVMADAPQGPGLDPVLARSPLAGALRDVALDETMLAAELKRGLTECKPGAEHRLYWTLAHAALGYVPLPTGRGARARDTESASPSQVLAGMVAGALAGARAAGIVEDGPREPERPTIGAEALRP